jgi:acyl-CoA reductase-like NAD-dependent aldehyde dehydrogenase
VPARLPFDPDPLVAGLTASGPARGWRSPLVPELTAELPTSTADDVDLAVRRIRAAQRGWATRSFADRAEVLLRFHDRLLDRLAEFADIVAYDSGKSRLGAVEEVLHTALSARYNARTAEHVLRSRRGRGLLPGLTRIDVHHQPKGLVGVIAPWNYPLSMAIADGLAAVAAGNGVLLKPDAQTPFSALAAVRLLEECGLPDGLWAVVHGDGAVVGSQVIDAADHVCFTGSTRTGKLVAARCAERLIGCSLELGGKNPLIVLDDADPERAAEGAVRACFANAGQLCVSTERLYVAEAVLPAFTAAFVRRIGAIQLGSSTSYEHTMGGLINADQLGRASAAVDDARRHGAAVLVGGRARPDLGPYAYEPTVLTGVTDQMRCHTEETFGPVVSLYPVRDEAEAVAAANDSAYGLNASVWTSDPARGRRVAALLHCGTVNVNEGFAATFGSIDAPMGGMGQSGLGRRQGPEGLLRFTETQSVGTQYAVPLAPSFGLSAATFVRVFTAGMRVLRRLNLP